MSKMILAAAVAAAVFVPGVQAADTSSYSLSSDHRITMVVKPVQSSQVAEDYAKRVPKGVRPLYSNIGYDYAKGRYISNSGWTISGPTSLIGEQVWIGAQFTPSRSATLVEADVAVGYVTGTMGFTLRLYTDAGGVPGTQLAAFTGKGLPAFGSCCHLKRVFSGTGVPVTAGTPYWLTVETNANTMDEWAVWNMNDVNQVDFGTNAVNNGAGWAPTQLLPGPSFAVFGQP